MARWNRNGWSCLAWRGQLSSFLGQEFEAILPPQGQTYQNLCLLKTYKYTWAAHRPYSCRPGGQFPNGFFASDTYQASKSQSFYPGVETLHPVSSGKSRLIQPSRICCLNLIPSKLIVSQHCLFCILFKYFKCSKSAPNYPGIGFALKLDPCSIHPRACNHGHIAGTIRGHRTFLEQAQVT